MVLRPLKVVIENVPDDYVVMVDKQLHPKAPELGKITIPFTKVLYIDQDDFRLQDSKDYFRLAPGRTVGLFGAPHPITYTSHKTDPHTGETVELVCRVEDGSGGSPIPKPKAYIQWVADHARSGSPVRIDEVRIFNQLFKSDNPAGLDNWLEDINPNSLEIVQGAMVEAGFWALAKKAFEDTRNLSRERLERAETAKKTESTVPVEVVASSTEHPHHDAPKATAEQLVGHECVRFQGLRVAYFALDKEAKLACLEEGPEVLPGARGGDRIILNRIVSLKEDAGKKSV
jgi:glutaminyl-tRNA synthetase